MINTNSFLRLFGKLDHMPAHEDAAPPVNPNELPANRYIDFEPILQDLPAQLSIGDPRLDALVAGVHQASILPTSKPVTFKSLSSGVAQRTISVTLPSDLKEGAEVSEYALPIPVTAFIAAPDIVDWREGRTDMKNGQPSRDIIKKYTRLPGRSAPPIQHAVVYIRPDGATYAVLTGDGAHRLCAAKQRGDADIFCRDVQFVQL